MRTSRTAAALAAAAILTGCGTDASTSEGQAAEPTPPECEHDTYTGDHVLAVLSADDRLDWVLCLIEASDTLVRFATGPDWDHTLLAATDDALVAAFGEETLRSLADGGSATLDGSEVRAGAFLNVGIIRETLPPADLAPGTYVTVVNTELVLEVDGDTARFGDVQVLDALGASNGTVLVVDRPVASPD